MYHDGKFCSPTRLWRWPWFFGQGQISKAKATVPRPRPRINITGQHWAAIFFLVYLVYLNAAALNSGWVWSSEISVRVGCSCRRTAGTKVYAICRCCLRQSRASEGWPWPRLQPQHVCRCSVALPADWGDHRPGPSTVNSSTQSGHSSVGRRWRWWCEFTSWISLTLWSRSNTARSLHLISDATLQCELKPPRRFVHSHLISVATLPCEFSLPCDLNEPIDQRGRRR